MNQKKQTTLAIFLFILVLLGNAVIFSIVPYLTKGTDNGGLGYNPFQVLFLYSVIATACMLPWAIKQGRKGLAPALQRWKPYSLRAVIEYTAYALTLIALSYLGTNFTLPMHTALNFITPLLATVVTIFVLKEKSYAHTWIALVIGFIGVLVITRPGMIPASPGVFYVLGAALAFSFCGVVIKILCSTESPSHIAFFMLLMTTIFSIPMGIIHWQTPSSEAWLWIAVIGVLSYAVQVLVGKAISKVPYMVIIPLNFVSLVFSAILGWIVYSQPLDKWTLLGAVMILAGCIYNTFRTRVHTEREAAIASTM
jgi:drug/metabolite transporter (DMT)-like permease